MDKKSKSIVISIAVIVFVFLTVVGAYIECRRRNEAKFTKRIITAVENETEDAGDYVIAIVPTENTTGHRVWFVVLRDNDNDTSVYWVSEYADEMVVSWVGTIE